MYHEALISSLKSLDIEPPESTDFNVIKEDFKKHQAYGMLAAAIHLAQNCRTGKISERVSYKQLAIFFPNLAYIPHIKHHQNTLLHISTKISLKNVSKRKG